MAKKLGQTLPKAFSDFYDSCTFEYNHPWSAENKQRFKEILEPCDSNARSRRLQKGNPLAPDDLLTAQKATREITACKCNCDIAPVLLIECALM